MVFLETLMYSTNAASKSTYKVWTHVCMSCMVAFHKQFRQPGQHQASYSIATGTRSVAERFVRSLSTQ